MANHIPIILIPTIIILVALLLSITFLAVWYRRRYERVPNQDSSSSSHPHSNSARDVEIHDTSAGDQVWFSRQVHRGAWRNWSLIIRNQRYTIRAGNTDPSKPEPPFVLIHEPCSLAHERQNAETDKQLLGTGYRGFYVCLIGWTRKSHKDICMLAERFVLPGLLRAADEEDFEGILQDFLKDLADRVLEPRRAADYAWFRENVTSHWKDVETRLMAGPGGKDDEKRPRSMLQMSSVDAGVRSWAYA